MRPTTKQVIEHFQMTTLPVESTYFVKTYRSKTSRPDGSADGSAIIALYSDEPRSCSLFHRLKYEEVWHFYAGAPLVLTQSHNGHDASAAHLGPDVTAGQVPQIVVPAHVWQTATSLGAWTLVGCTVAPAFDFAGFELAPPGWRPTPRM